MWNVESAYTLVATTRKMPRGSMDLEAISLSMDKSKSYLKQLLDLVLYRAQVWERKIM
jgi:hypothetical protein